jgi:hypothetical protein
VPTSFRLAGLDRADAVGAHHLVVFVFDDVAVPDELSWVREPDAEAGYLAGIGDERVLEAALPGLGRPRIADESGRWLRLAILIEVISVKNGG